MINKKNIIAIDPGASGGIATFANEKIHAVKMPKNVRDLKLFLDFQKNTYSDLVVYIEKVQAYSNGDDAPGKKFGINKMLKNYAELLTVIKLLGIPFVEVYPVSWQSTLGLKIKNTEKLPLNKFKTVRKNLYKKYAENSFPEIKKVTLATSDALCLVSFALHKQLHDPRWIDERIQNKETDSMF